MLGRLLGEQVVIEFTPLKNLPLIKGDPGMIEQVIMNLCVNARDAMPRGGVLTITAEEVEIKADAILKNHEARQGQFVRLAVADTGCGMDEQTRARIFEPFFTTKEVGKGTGLGLATVFGIAKQHDGWVEVETRVGIGSTFSVYLPARPELAVKSSSNPQSIVAGGDETILVVEDDAQVRRLTAAVLKRKGYTVLEAGNGPEAIEQWSNNGAKIDLLFSDMVMPGGLSGLDLARKMRGEKPGLGVILFSGYSPDLAAARAAGEKGLMYLPKPCSQELLVKTVRQCLDARRKISIPEVQPL
jgi:CheY-like chemotaxis protein